ncbi:hypothetical protein AVEN_139674-1 [Araneus ventricosus]|uniref:Uncharacterized protein n=1 Tax=Araneus ventricosus TaxID=182803 RepID=A0A4Y2N8M5_ARAVE|nr:hypothetical protein AVEN_139674-1 [Araneus ventricosus]
MFSIVHALPFEMLLNIAKQATPLLSQEAKCDFDVEVKLVNFHIYYKGNRPSWSSYDEAVSKSSAKKLQSSFPNELRLYLQQHFPPRGRVMYAGFIIYSPKIFIFGQKFCGFRKIGLLSSLNDIVADESTQGSTKLPKEVL